MVDQNAREAADREWARQHEQEKIRRLRPKPHQPGNPYDIRGGVPDSNLQDNYVVKDMIQQGDLGVIYGPPGCGKTFLTLYLALCLAGRDEFMGKRVRTIKGRVLYVAAEAGNGIQNRIHAAAAELGLPRDLPFCYLPHGLNLSSEQDVSDFLLTLRENPDIKHVVLDTVSRLLGGADENSPEGMGNFVSVCDRIRELGVTLILVHHTGKDADKGLRGHSSLMGAVDFQFQIVNHGGTCELKIEKVREGDAGWSAFFRLKRKVLGLDQDGDEVTTCVVEPLSPDEAEPYLGGSKSSGRPRKSDELAELAQGRLCDAVNTGGEEAPGSNHIPRGVRVVDKTVWRKHLEMAGLINPEGNPREELRRIIITLQAQGRIGMWGDLVWPLTPARHNRHKTP